MCTALKHSCVALRWSDPFQITYIILELGFIKESFGIRSQKIFWGEGHNEKCPNQKKDKEKVFGHVTRAFKGKQTAATNVSWLNLIRLTSSTAHLKKRRKPWIGPKCERWGEALSLCLSLSLTLCLLLSFSVFLSHSLPRLRGPEWIHHIIMDMLLHRWQNDNKPFEKRSKYNYCKFFAGIRTMAK